MFKILLVEDNEMNRDILSRRLAKRGFEVVMAVDGEYDTNGRCDSLFKHSLIDAPQYETI